MTPANLQSQIERLANFPRHRCTGRVTHVIGPVVQSRGPLCAVGDECQISTSTGERIPAEVVGLSGTTVLAMPLCTTANIRFGDLVETRGMQAKVAVGTDLLGRVLGATGAELKPGSQSLRVTHCVPVRAPVRSALERRRIAEPLGCGIRAIDALATCGRGQRIGIFGGSGVGKTTLIGMMCRATGADVNVLALVGERGREVGEFLDALGEDGRRRSVVVVSTSDESPILRLRAALSAHAIAEFFASLGKHVLLVVDSLTRFAMAQREIGLAAGEPPTTKGYTPSVFSALAKLVERAGNFQNGSVTGFYTVLMEGDDQQDPIVDAVRSLLDGHIMLDRRLAIANHYPPIGVLDSLSRLMPALVGTDHLNKAGQFRNLLALHNRCEDLLRVGAYQAGTDPALDHAIAVVPELMRFLQQTADERPSFSDTVSALLSLPV